ncbi:transcriptional repressor NrdR [Symbiobacterium terraclitae]|uniref:Transcriptional repressor NrdR n=1 Tax=Symbiobacterium terraclitae TaxID=557451 RepID=A0ABS4JVV6_9FIRM|nr:transcriptional regulator NrdR [Symbiobacterium terraclitae]MBP2019682.1 transcriptional repressor NrdR [Symbiobacterium terraclitae]
MKCPFCGAESRVVESRHAPDEEAIRRRRECTSCGRRFSTMERVEAPPLIVVKKDGRREQFNRDKLLGGILKACEKRPVPLEAIEKLVDDIERDLRSALDREVPSVEIGERVMNALRAIDGVAYVRFASVYREFKDLNEFREQLEQLLRAH